MAIVSYAVERATRLQHQYAFEIRMIRRPADARNSLVQQYLQGLSETEHKKVVSRIMTMAEIGPHRNRERYGSLGDGVYELKVGQHRIPFFYGGQGIIVLTHGFFKTHDEAPPAEVRRAKELRALYIEEFGD
ncbi:MAG: type II toxin-antitoxin system RelE/ParE family toxin [Armatimonadota bacterium]|nr:type II toxin-antitoxin system RelE/ParE family toxin [Armatimonadota bacterium]